MGYNAALLRTPPALEDTGIRETPKPVRARIAELERQNGILLGQKQSLERKHQADIAKLQSEIAALTGTTSTSSLAVQRTQAEAAAAQQKYEATISSLKKQLLQTQEQAKKGKEFGEGMLRERLRMVEDEKNAMSNEFDLRSRLSEHRTILQTSKLEAYAVELEQKALKAEQAKLYVEHKNAVAQAKVADLEDELAEALELTDRVESLQTDLETMTEQYESASKALSSLKDARSSTDSESQAIITELRASLKTAKAEITSLTKEATADKKQIAKLERNVASKTEEMEELQKEKEELSSGEKNKGGESDKQVRAMKVEIKDLKSELEGKDEELKEVEASLERVKKEAKEKEKAAKRGGKEEVESLRTKINDLEDEIENLTTKNNALVTKARAYRDEVKASRAAGTKVTAVEKKETAKRPAAVAEDSEEEEEAVQPVKKAKRDPPAAKKPLKTKSKAVSEDDQDEDDYVADKPDKEVRRGRGLPKPSYVEESISEIVQEKPAAASGSNKPTAAPAPVQPVTALKRPTPKVRSMSSKMQPTIMEEDEDEENEEVEEVEQEVVKRKSKDVPVAVDAEKKKKRKLGGGLPIAPAFDFNGLIGAAANSSGMIPSTLSPMKNSIPSLPRNSMSVSRSFGSSLSSSRNAFGPTGRR